MCDVKGQGFVFEYINGLAVQNCGNFNVLALELPQSCAKSLMCSTLASLKIFIEMCHIQYQNKCHNSDG